MGNRSLDWYRQAERDLEQAHDSRASGRHEWACFAAHQAVEKAAKALHMHRGQEAWGHVVAKLLNSLPDDLAPAPEMIDKARALDNFYIPTRYPNGHAAGAPFEHYGSLQSEQAVQYAGEILGWVRLQMA